MPENLRTMPDVNSAVEKKVEVLVHEVLRALPKGGHFLQYREQYVKVDQLKLRAGRLIQENCFANKEEDAPKKTDLLVATLKNRFAVEFRRYALGRSREAKDNQATEPYLTAVNLMVEESLLFRDSAAKELAAAWNAFKRNNQKERTNNEEVNTSSPLKSKFPSRSQKEDEALANMRSLEIFEKVKRNTQGAKQNESKSRKYEPKLKARRRADNGAKLALALLALLVGVSVILKVVAEVSLPVFEGLVGAAGGIFIALLFNAIHASVQRVKTPAGLAVFSVGIFSALVLALEFEVALFSSAIPQLFSIASVAWLAPIGIGFLASLAVVGLTLAYVGYVSYMKQLESPPLQDAAVVASIVFKGFLAGQLNSTVTPQAGLKEGDAAQQPAVVAQQETRARLGEGDVAQQPAVISQEGSSSIPSATL